MSRHDELALALWEAERTRVPIAPPSEGTELSIADAYAIQRAGRELRLRDGARLVGHKVGLTSRAMQEMLGVDQPDFGYLTVGMLSDSDSDCALAIDRFIAPRVEAEVAFRLGAALPGPSPTITDVLAATEAVAPAIEVIDSRVADWRITIADTVADNASCGHVVLGAWRSPEGIDLAALDGRMEVRDAGGAVEAVSGRGEAVLGHPAAAVAWLARALHEYGGDPLQPGDVVLPGAVARALPVAAGSAARASMGALGDVVVHFTNEREGQHG